MTIKDKVSNAVCSHFEKDLAKLGFTNRIIHLGQPNGYYWEEYSGEKGTLEICIDNGEKKVKIFLLPNGDFEKPRYSLNELYVKLHLGSYQSVRTSCTSEKKIESVLGIQIRQLSETIAALEQELVSNPKFSFD